MPFFEYSEPDSNIAVSANYILNAGDGAIAPANKWQALADLLPNHIAAGPGSPWTRLEIALALNDTARFGMENPQKVDGSAGTPIDSNTRCEAVRIVAHVATIGGSQIWRFGNGPQNTELMGDTGFAANGQQEIKVGPWATQAMGASVGTFKEWEQADVNDLRLRCFTGSSLGLGAAHMYRAYLTLRLVARPYAQIDSPQADSTVTSLTPRITWSQQNQGRPAEPQKRYHVKVFKRTTVDASGSFDPETASALVSSLVSSSANFADVPVGRLQFGTQYTAYVKVATSFNGVDWWGPWSNRKNFVTQSRPVVDVTAPTGTIIDTARPEVQWTFTDADGDKQSFYMVEIHQRPGAAWPSDYNPEATANRVNVRYESGLVASSDLEHTIGVNLLNSTNYRAYVLALHSLPVRLDSNWDFSEFTTGFSGPMAPTLAAAASGDRVTLLVTPATPTVTTKGMTLGAEGGWVETADHADLDHLTDFEYRFEIAMLDWTPEQEAVIAAKGDFDEGNGAWIFSVMTDGKFRLRISTDGSAGPVKDYISSTSPGLTPGQRRFIRFTHDNGTPGGSTTVTFSHSATDSGYVNIGTAPVITGVENVFNSTAPLRLGARGSTGLDTWQGYFYFASGRSSIGGTVITSPTFTGLPLGNASFTDAQSKLWVFKGDAEVEFKENPNADAFDIERSVDGGLTYQFFRCEFRPQRRNIFKGGFEDAASVWNPTGSTCTTVNTNEAARTGSRSLKIVKTATGANATLEEDALTSGLLGAASPGEEIQDGVWLYQPASGSRLGFLTLEWVNAANANIGTVVGAFTGLKQGVWTFVSVQGVAPANTVKWRTSLTLAALSGSIPSGEVFYMDDAEGYLASEKDWLSRSSENLPKKTSLFVVIDHEPPFGKDLAYRARGKTFGLGTEITSPYSAPGIVAVGENRLWFKSTLDPRLNATFKTQDRWLAMKKRKSRSIYEAIGRENPIVIKHAPAHDAFAVSIVVLGQNYRDQLEALLASNHTMFIQSPKGNWWAEIAGDIDESASLWDDLRGEQDAWLLTIPFQEVDK